jgi:hypothetical protein
MEKLTFTAGVSRPRWRDLILLAVIPAVAIAVAASSAFSSSGVTNPTMVVRADKLSVDYRNKAVLWSGHVQLTLMNYAHYPFTIKSDATR